MKIKGQLQLELLLPCHFSRFFFFFWSQAGKQRTGSRSAWPSRTLKTPRAFLTLWRAFFFALLENTRLRPLEEVTLTKAHGKTGPQMSRGLQRAQPAHTAQTQRVGLRRILRGQTSNERAGRYQYTNEAEKSEQNTIKSGRCTYNK